MDQDTAATTLDFVSLYKNDAKNPDQSIHSSQSNQSLLSGDYSTLDGTSIGSGQDKDAYTSSEGDSRGQYDTSTTLPSLPEPEEAKLVDDASVPFRIDTSYKHSTWAKTFHSRPEYLVCPQSIQEFQKLVLLAQRQRRRIVPVGFGHSPSDLTCTSSWIVSLRNYKRVLSVREYHRPERSRRTSKYPSCQPAGRILVQAGISLQELNQEASARHGLILPNLGSIDVQTIAGAIATATHGASHVHGLLSESVRGLRIVLASGRAVWCSTNENEDLFRAALVSLGALGIITELEIELVAAGNIEWEHSIITVDKLLSQWDSGFWTEAEWVRCNLFPYIKRITVWKANRTSKPVEVPRHNVLKDLIIHRVYMWLLRLANNFPVLNPYIEWLMNGVRHGFRSTSTARGVEEQHKGLVLDCLFSQFVNEWAIPLHRGPEALNRLVQWLNHDEHGSGIPHSSQGLWVHSPIEIRITNGTKETQPVRGFLDPSMPDGPTIYINAILYRPYGIDGPAKERYYKGFEYLMKELGGRPHWAKNFDTVTKEDVAHMYGDVRERWLDVRSEVDPDGMFTGPWHRRLLLREDDPIGSCEEREKERKENWRGGVEWVGEQMSAS